MTFYLYNRENHIYCEPLHKDYMPEMAACGFDSQERAEKYAAIAGLKKKDTRIRRLRGSQEMLVCAAINDLNIESKKDFLFLPVHNKTVLSPLDKNGDVMEGIKITAHGVITDD